LDLASVGQINAGQINEAADNAREKVQTFLDSKNFYSKRSIGIKALAKAMKTQGNPSGAAEIAGGGARARTDSCRDHRGGSAGAAGIQRAPTGSRRG
jgi:hypothetical protein